MIYRQEHPKPQFERVNWRNLNGEWEFEYDNSLSLVHKDFFKNGSIYSKKIIVPFCPESKLSGIENTDFINGVWYRRTFVLKKENLAGSIFLHFGAVDYLARVYLNGELVGIHKGGHTSFKFEISNFATDGENTLVVYAEDDVRNETHPTGKQCFYFKGGDCLYTRTTGIWQTVWLEFVPKKYIESVKYYPDVDSQTLIIKAKVCGDGVFYANASFAGKDMGGVSVKTSGGELTAILPLKEKHLWELGVGGLYDLSLTFNEDKVKSYFGLRKVRYEGFKFMLNDKSVFQRLILDQGYYPDGIMTAPSDEELKKDILLSMACGMNGARLHQKIFEERYLYHCDKLGYMVWAEFPSWGIDYTTTEGLPNILAEWIEEINRDFNHPSIVTWCPLNETNNHMYKLTRDEVVETIYNVTKAIDDTRPVIDTSGFYHVKTDCFDVHDYYWDTNKLHYRYDDIAKGELRCEEILAFRFQKYTKGLPVNISEIGGRDFHDGTCWGDTLAGGVDLKEENIIQKLDDVISYYLDHGLISGICYTQLYDIEYETNGFYDYNRKPKLDIREVKRIFSRKAAIED